MLSGRRGRRAIALAAGAAALLLAGCGGDGGDAATVATAVPPDEAPLTTGDGTSVPSTPTVPPTETAPDDEGRILSAADRAGFDAFAASLDGRVGLAVAPVGRDQPVERVGSLRTAVAWSTAKVPIAMAVLARGARARDRRDVRAAITASDNAAARRLWRRLGGGAAAARAANAQLRAAGDDRTRIEARALRGAAYTPFGQTDWALADQARFTAGMACTSAGGEVLGLMGETIDEQRWGLGAVGLPAELKGGWGPGSRPGEDGGHLNRQMGVVTIDGRPLAVAVAALPADGEHDSGTRMLTALAEWLVDHADVAGLPSRARC